MDMVLKQKNFTGRLTTVPKVQQDAADLWDEGVRGDVF